MGKQTDIKLRGTKDSLIFYEWKGGFYIRNKPTVVNQTKATKASAGKFGHAIRLSGALRQALAPLIPAEMNRSLMYRLNNVLYQWLLEGQPVNDINNSSITSLKAFELNEACSMRQRIKINLQADWQTAGQVSISLPAMNPVQQISAPQGIKAVELIMMTACCNVNTPADAIVHSTQLVIPWQDNLLPPQLLALPVTAGTDQLIITVMAIRYQLKGYPKFAVCNKSTWMPAVIVDAVYTGN